ncbi:HD family phosphohydrolase [Desulfosarcina ovata subsp. sediminis]|uniref:HD family phosphohydrolase n=1 Tax=Desulfosarcina ovata subsp. sediminis TaxID=885957 RepID=A0A5K7ZL76_9BACT|nr:HDOD domain-containing protein [Desulfosarcina ovata]BBO81806.1 HD family phosphohydrolase [Desulfosarcina ovata subsp. sediminis]
MFQTVVKSAQLISLPEVYLKLKDLIEEPDYTMAEVSLLVGQDPAMATRFLRAVNNPLNRRTLKIETISHAVSMLGIHQVHDIVLSASVAEAFEGIQNNVMDNRKFWQRSYYTALMNKRLADECQMLDSNPFFVMGLLHDIGHMFMYIAIAEAAQETILNAKKQNRPIYQVEREMLGFDYAEVGGYVMRQWDLPKNFQAITHFHTQPGKAAHYGVESALLHLSTMLVTSDLEAGVFGEGTFTVDATVWSTTDLTMEQCLSARKTVAGEYREVADSLFI